MPLSLAAIIETLSCDVQQVLAALQKIIGQHFDLLQKFEAADVYFCLYGTTLDIKLSHFVFFICWMLMVWSGVVTPWSLVTPRLCRTRALTELRPGVQAAQGM